jgi:hypothetical protein
LKAFLVFQNVLFDLVLLTKQKVQIAQVTNFFFLQILHPLRTLLEPDVTQEGVVSSDEFAK